MYARQLPAGGWTAHLAMKDSTRRKIGQSRFSALSTLSPCSSRSLLIQAAPDSRGAAHAQFVPTLISLPIYCVPSRCEEDLDYDSHHQHRQHVSRERNSQVDFYRLLSPIQFTLAFASQGVHRRELYIGHQKTNNKNGNFRSDSTRVRQPDSSSFCLGRCPYP